MQGFYTQTDQVIICEQDVIGYTGTQLGLTSECGLKY